MSICLFGVPVILLLLYTLNIAVSEALQLSESIEFANLERLVVPYLSQSFQTIAIESILQEPAEYITNPENLRVTSESVLYLLSSLGFLSSLVINFVLILIITFYALRDGSQLRSWVEETPIFPPLMLEYLKRVDEDLSAVFFGNILHASITAVLALTVFSILSYLAPSGVQVPYPALVGILMGVASLIPVVGSKIVYVPYSVYLIGAAYYSDPTSITYPIVFFAIAYLLVDTIPDIVLRPYVSSKRIHLGLVMITFITGPQLFGWIGIFLGPLFLVTIYHLLTFALPRLVQEIKNTSRRGPAM
jgi:predicted PurR-regulated permease PerM